MIKNEKSKIDERYLIKDMYNFNFMLNYIQFGG